MADDFTDTIIERCRWARAHDESRPSSSWPTGEQLAVALVLRDKDHLAEMGYTLEQAADSVCNQARLSAFELTGWLNDTRAAVESGKQG